MKKISDVPRGMMEEVLSRLPVTSLRVARFTCKNWNMISKDASFTKKHFREAKRKHEIQMVMMLEHKLYLVSINLLNPSIHRIDKLISLDDANGVDISTIFHCDSLILCVTKDISRLVVWNHYSGQTKWIEPRNSYHRMDSYAIGYEKKNSIRSHKILRFIEDYDYIRDGLVHEFDIFDLNSNLWKAVDVTPYWMIEYYRRGLTLKGNTYWFAHEKLQQGTRALSDVADFLICFNFTTERFGLRLPLPFHGTLNSTVSLSSVRDEQLAVLYQPSPREHTVKIWISNKIEPNEVSWRKLFLEVDMKPLMGCGFFKFGRISSLTRRRRSQWFFIRKYIYSSIS